MSGSGGGTGGAGSGGATSFGFTQGTNAFSGLTNTDLRPRQRRRRRYMRKDITDLVETLYQSVTGIAASDTEDRDGLLNKSFGEFAEALEEHLDQAYGPPAEMMPEGLEHLGIVMHALANMREELGKLEAVPEEDLAALGPFLDAGVLTLSKLVNLRGELLGDEAEIEEAEANGQLVKLDLGETEDAGELLIKTDLPPSLCDYFAAPQDVMFLAADVAGALIDDARGLADYLLKVDPDSITEEVALDYPLLFDVELQKQPPFATQGAAPAGEPDENLGEGGADFDDANEPTATADVPNDPVEMIQRLASVILVLAGSLSQGMAQGQGAQPGAQPGMSPEEAGANYQGNAGTGDQRDVGLQRLEPLLDQPLAKLLENEADLPENWGEVTLAEALDQLSELAGEVERLGKVAAGAGTMSKELEVLKRRVAELSRKPAASPGMAKFMPAPDKGRDFVGMGADSEVTADKLEKLKAADPEGGAAAALLIKAAHATGGRPFEG